MGNTYRLVVPSVYQFLYQPYRYKGAYGGRGGGKSWAFADALVTKAHEKQLRILCARELQNSIKDSVHKLLKDEISRMGLAKYFKVTKDIIESRVTGSEFAFKGLRYIGQDIKSHEGADICWVEEAHSVSDENWNILRPTIRKPGSEIWATWNPYKKKDPVYQFLAKDPPPDSYVVKVGWQDNPWFPEVLDIERQDLLKKNPKLYRHVYDGEPLVDDDLVIFRESCIRFYRPEDLPETFDRQLQSWDLAFKDKKDNDFVAGQVWGKHKANLYLLDQIHGRLSFTATVQAIVAMSRKWPKAHAKLIEDKANGPAVLDALRNDVSGMRGVEPYGSKVARAHAVSALWEAGNIFLPMPEYCPWVREFIAEVTSFPVHSEHDDQVDAMTQALHELDGSALSILEKALA